MTAAPSQRACSADRAGPAPLAHSKAPPFATTRLWHGASRSAGLPSAGAAGTQHEAGFQLSAGWTIAPGAAEC